MNDHFKVLCHKHLSIRSVLSECFFRVTSDCPHLLLSQSTVPVAATPTATELEYQWLPPPATELEYQWLPPPATLLEYQWLPPPAADLEYQWLSPPATELEYYWLPPPATEQEYHRLSSPATELVYYQLHSPAIKLEYHWLPPPATELEYHCPPPPPATELTYLNCAPTHEQMKRFAEELMQRRTWLEKPRMRDHMGNPIREVFLQKNDIYLSTQFRLQTSHY